MGSSADELTRPASRREMVELLWPVGRPPRCESRLPLASGHGRMCSEPWRLFRFP